uniref:Uncharacterized protein n=1 Tax=Strongyloides papillosus TaxID=174720 RepID=A0A0N5BI97_STREA
MLHFFLFLLFNFLYTIHTCGKKGKAPDIGKNERHRMESDKKRFKNNFIEQKSKSLDPNEQNVNGNNENKNGGVKTVKIKKVNVKSGRSLNLNEAKKSGSKRLLKGGPNNEVRVSNVAIVDIVENCKQNEKKVVSKPVTNRDEKTQKKTDKSIDTFKKLVNVPKDAFTSPESAKVPVNPSQYVF